MNICRIIYACCIVRNIRKQLFALCKSTKCMYTAPFFADSLRALTVAFNRTRIICELKSYGNSIPDAGIMARVINKCLVHLF